MNALAEFFRARMLAGTLRQADPCVAARHLIALFESETVFPCLMGIRSELSRAELKGAVQRAVDVFLGGYGRGDGKTETETIA
jgi:hypothetical protein